ncbi:MAG: MazG-like family protein [Clostridia bacterium]|nr:MazG-like family protein [Clostridia bacterium]
MALFDKDIDITRNIKMIEWLKSELLTDLANLFKSLVNGMREDVHDAISETLSNIILISYLLGRRLGLSYNSIEMKIESKVKLGLIENHDVEKYYGDLSELAKHLNSSRIKRQ